jgi:hypothetical protein
VLRKNLFIRPMAPTLAKAPPIGDDWIHQVKFDGWRIAATDTPHEQKNIHGGIGGETITAHLRSAWDSKASSRSASIAPIDPGRRGNG